jgi:hypothetical protein
MPLLIRIHAPEPVAATYNLRFRWSILNHDLCCDATYHQLADLFVEDWQCDLESLGRRLNDYRLDAGRDLLLPLESPSGPGSPRLPDGEIMPNIGPVADEDRPVDRQGRALRAQTFVVEVGAGGRFQAWIDVDDNVPLVARLWGGGVGNSGPKSALIVEAATSAARDALGLFGSPGARLNFRADTLSTTNDNTSGFLKLAARNLSPGFYTLALSRFYEGTRAMIYLSRENQADESFPTVEDLNHPEFGRSAPAEVGFLYERGQRPRPKLEHHAAVRVKFLATPGERYRISTRITAGGIFAVLGDMPIRGIGDPVVRYYPMLHPDAKFRAETISDGAPAELETSPAVELRLPVARAGRRYRLSFSTTLGSEPFSTSLIDEIVGTGGPHSWFVEPSRNQNGFYQLEELENAFESNHVDESPRVFSRIPPQSW